jgi:hypothetical protein
MCGIVLLLLPALRWFSVQGTHRPLPPPGASTGGVLGVMVVCCWSAAVWGAAHEMRACLVADNSGIRWRDVFGWQELRWDEITDLYVQLQARGHKQFVIQGTTKTLRVQDYGWRNVPALLKFVAHHARKAARRDWGEISMQREEPL